ASPFSYPFKGLGYTLADCPDSWDHFTLLPEELLTAAEMQEQKLEAWSKPTISTYLNGIFDQHNATPMATWFYDPYQLWVTSDVDSFEGLKGLKVRGSSPEQAEFLSSIGASPVNIQPGELYIALQRGTVDGTITGQGAVVGFKWSEVLKGGILANVMMTSTGPILNRDRFNSLPSEYQEILSEEMASVEEDLRNYMPEYTENLHEGLREEGLSLVDPSPELYEQLRNAAVNETYPAWAERAGPKGLQMLEEYGVEVGQ
ncbi:TRAP transporter substrate-binding protein, partial [Roseovarius sp. MMSF_3281]|uniref:TRAP transporter substrate-binding protein n=1 Tax=Roseovarius sp. MMSF_3281 TaxID=3046694 RepID=UPI00273E3624